MKDSIVALSLLAGGVVAQQMNGVPALRQALQVAAFGDGEDYQVCLEVVDKLAQCADDWGGIENVDNIDPDEILACACCDDSTVIASDYATCSNYIVKEEPSFTSEADAYGVFATMCSQSASCSATGLVSGSGSGSSASAAATTTSGFDAADETSQTSMITGTPGASVSECDSMYGMFESCMAKTDGFADLPYRSQAACYCCDESSPQETWTDELDQYASTCWDWAMSGATDTAWDYARTFATFCDNFSDICEDKTSSDSSDSSTAPSDSTSATETGEVIVSVTNTNSDAAAETDQPDAAVSLRVSSAAGVVGIVAALMML